MKRCSICGMENDDLAKFCGGCGNPMAEPVSAPTHKPVSAPASKPAPGSASGETIEIKPVSVDPVVKPPRRPKDSVNPGAAGRFTHSGKGNGLPNNNNQKHNLLLIIIAILVILIALMTGLLVYSAWFAPDKGTHSAKQKSEQSSEQSDVNNNDKETSGNSEDAATDGEDTLTDNEDTASDNSEDAATNDEDTLTDDEDTAKDSDSDETSDFPGVDSSNTPDYSNALDPETYNKVETSDGRFSFYYPPGFFSEVDQDGDNYTFKTSDDSAVLYARTESTDSAPADSVKEAHDEHLDELESESINVDISGPEHEDGWAHSLLSGRIKDTDDKWDYYISVSDGEKRYSLEFRYTDPDGSGVISESSYMVDCLYRYCEHSGTGFKVRTYDMYRNEDMGERK